MRPIAKLRKARLIYAGAIALIMSIPATAVAFPGSPISLSDAASSAAPASTLRAAIGRRQIKYGDHVIVTGSSSSAAAGHTLWLEFAPSRSSSWRALSSAKVDASGRFSLSAALRQSGFVRVVDGGGAPAGAAGAVAPSSSLPVSVGAGLQVPARAIGVLAGQAIDVRGKLLPAAPGRHVVLQARLGGGWRVLAAARTGPRGGFDLHYLAGGLGEQSLRVRFSGDFRNASVAQPAGQLTVYTQSVASWYDDAGSTACGFHVFYGVANKSLPCGTKVTFRLNGHTVTAVVDDRGPYVDGREWDFNQNTAAALGFDGVGTVWSSQ